MCPWHPIFCISFCMAHDIILSFSRSIYPYIGWPIWYATVSGQAAGDLFYTMLYGYTHSRTFITLSDKPQCVVRIKRVLFCMMWWNIYCYYKKKTHNILSQSLYGFVFRQYAFLFTVVTTTYAFRQLVCSSLVCCVYCDALCFVVLPWRPLLCEASTDHILCKGLSGIASKLEGQQFPNTQADPLPVSVETLETHVFSPFFTALFLFLIRC